MHSYIRPNASVVLRLPSGTLKIVEVIPNTIINIGKYGSFPAAHIIGRPYYLTFELLDKEEGQRYSKLRIVPAIELHEEELRGNHATASETRDEKIDTVEGIEFDIVGENGEIIMRSNRFTVDDPTRQTLSMEEIEELKRVGTGSGKDIIAKIMKSHMAIDEKTSFSLAKYTLRKSRKYLRRFTVLPLDVSMLLQIISERESHRIFDLRIESLGLIMSWANIHHGADDYPISSGDEGPRIGGARWLVIDETGGLVVAALAERMGILYPEEENEQDQEAAQDEDDSTKNDDIEMAGASAQLLANPAEEDQSNLSKNTQDIMSRAGNLESEDGAHPPRTATNQDLSKRPQSDQLPTATPPRTKRSPPTFIPAMSATNTTLTLLHPAAQPNLSLLRHFSFTSDNPLPTHPLYKHLKTLSWLQLLDPSSDSGYAEPPVVPDPILQSWKSSKRGAYYRKRRRWERVRRVVDETRGGGFDGLVVVSNMEPATVLRHLVPLVKGGGQVVVYHPCVEPLSELADLYSRERRTAYMEALGTYRASVNPYTPGKSPGPSHSNGSEERNGIKNEPQGEQQSPEDNLNDFPVNPTLLLTPMLQTARAVCWQVLPGRTHPEMTSKGGPEGYLFTATRVIPYEGKVAARGRFQKKRKLEKDGSVFATPVQGLGS